MKIAIYQPRVSYYVGGGGCAYERLIFGNGHFDNEHPDCKLKKGIFSYVWKHLETFYGSEKLRLKGAK